MASLGHSCITSPQRDSALHLYTITQLCVWRASVLTKLARQLVYKETLSCQKCFCTRDGISPVVCAPRPNATAGCAVDTVVVVGPAADAGTPNAKPVEAGAACCVVFPMAPRLKLGAAACVAPMPPKLKPPVVAGWVAVLEPNTKPEGATGWLAGALLGVDVPSPPLPSPSAPVMPADCVVLVLLKFSLGAFPLNK